MGWGGLLWGLMGGLGWLGVQLMCAAIGSFEARPSCQQPALRITCLLTREHPESTVSKVMSWGAAEGPGSCWALPLVLPHCSCWTPPLMPPHKFLMLRGCVQGQACECGGRLFVQVPCTDWVPCRALLAACTLSASTSGPCAATT